MRVNMNKIALGTVQFGLDYGVANVSGKVSRNEAAQILLFAQNNNITTLDTAISYGESEASLGENDLSFFSVVSKLPAAPSTHDNISQWVREEVQGSLHRLNIKKLYGLLLHHPGQLFEQGGDDLYAALVQQKELGLVEKIGVSVYSPEELEKILTHFHVDLIQIPFNVFDQRLLYSDLWARLKRLPVEIHVRSIFLQGLLLLAPEARPVKFQKWATQWKKWDHWLAENTLTPLAGCLQTVLGVEGLDKVVVGIDSLAQLREIVERSNQPTLSWPSYLACSELELLNPSLWSSL